MRSYEVINILDEKDRRELIEYLHKTFMWTPFAPAKSIGDLYNLLQNNYRKLPYEVQDLRDLLHFIGWIGRDDITLPILVRPKSLPESTDYLRPFAEFENHKPTKVQLMAIIDKLEFKKKALVKTKQEDIAESLADHKDHLEFFYTHWCVTAREDSILKGIAVKYWRCPFKVLHDLYLHYCKVAKIRPVDKKTLLNFIDMKGHKRSKGYANGVSGTSFFYGLYAPGCGASAEIPFTIKHNKCVILVNNRLYFKDGTPLSVLEEQTKSILDCAFKEALLIADDSEITRISSDHLEGKEEEASANNEADGEKSKSIPGALDSVDRREDVREVVAASADKTAQSNTIDDGILADHKAARNEVSKHPIGEIAGEITSETVDEIAGEIVVHESVPVVDNEEDSELASSKSIGSEPVSGIFDDVDELGDDEEIDEETKKILQRYGLENYGK